MAIKSSSDTDGSHSWIALIDNVGNTYWDTACGCIHTPVHRIYTVIEWNKSNIMTNKIGINQISAYGIVSPKSIQVFNYDTIYVAILYVAN